MTLHEGEDVRLLTTGAALQYAGVSDEAFRNWEAMGLLEAVETPAGPRWRMDEIRDLLSGHLPVQETGPDWVPPQQASLILDVGTTTLSRNADEGRLSVRRTLNNARRYDRRECRFIAAERERLADPKWWPPPKTD